MLIDDKIFRKWQDCPDCKRVSHGSSRRNAQLFLLFFFGCNFVPLLKPAFLSRMERVRQSAKHVYLLAKSWSASVASVGPSINAPADVSVGRKRWEHPADSACFQGFSHPEKGGTLPGARHAGNRWKPTPHWWGFQHVLSICILNVLQNSIAHVAWSPEVHFLSDSNHIGTVCLAWSIMQCD